MADKTVTLAEQEWQQLVAIIANGIGYVPFQKLVQQLQAQGAQSDGRSVVPGDGLDPDPPDLPLGSRRARATEPGR